MKNEIGSENVGTMDMTILSFVEVVDSAIRSESASELGESPAYSFSSLIDSAIRSSNASVADFIASPSPFHAIASAVDLRSRSDAERLFTNSFSLDNKIDCQGNVKKPSYAVFRGHKNYDLMLNLQLGIRYTVGKHSWIFRELRLQDFDPKTNFWTRFPPEGSRFTPPHQSVDFRWKDYCPVVFKHLRQLFGIDPADYMLAICGNDTLRDISSLGKSGSLICLAQNRFIIKTLKKSQVKVLVRMLPSYYQHVCRYENSLLTKFLGVHCVKHSGGQKTRFIVMANVFCSSEYPIHQRYDLKGSSYGRTTDKPLEEIDETTTLKDLDLYLFFRLEKSWFQELKRQLDRDCEFLEAERIMDYSFLIGLHFRDDSSRIEHDMNREHLVQLGTNMPAIAERVCKDDGDVSDVILYFGIINILQDYDISKKLEHAYKSLQVDPSSISAVDPKLYSKRFKDFMGKIFVEQK
ncbi:hypothetical protein VNO78_30818 [Psophocarpus tetragonolobus]|uniref:1-phosphatidylinositol-4-phosphate 5-kinase n=1 Tax=Psophocarpus tetragonolobus TaxID=3891 RepID=A0AAN9X6A3_PSOTE